MQQAMVTKVASVLLFAVLWDPARATERRAGANPIRRVVTMLQNIKAKVEEEGKDEESLFEKFTCYCQKNGKGLAKSVEASKEKASSLAAGVEGSGEQKAQTAQDLKKHQASRVEARDALQKADALRAKEAAAFALAASESQANIGALTEAIAALEKGMAGAFLQTGSAAALKRFAMEKAELPDVTRQELLSFLSGGEGYAPRSGEIVGILKQMKDEMLKNQLDAAADEEGSKESYEGITQVKEKEVASLTLQIEEEQKRLGKLGVEIAGMENDLEDTQESLEEDAKFLAELQKGCSTKAKDWEKVKEERARELVALSQTIKVLNDDDSLELFRETLPGSAASLVQVQETAAALRARALAAVRAAPRDGISGRPELNLIALALLGKQAGFDKVVSMVDEMVATLKREQADDDSKKAYCAKHLDAAEDKQRGLKLSFSDSETAIREMEGSVEKLQEEIAALEAGIKSLDASVAEATAQRQAEHKAYSDLMAADSTAKEVLVWAKNRMYKYYNVKLYKAPAKKEVTEAERISANFGVAEADSEVSFVQISAVEQDDTAQPSPPSTPSSYKKKTEESNGVIAMLNLLISDLDKGMTQADVEEKDAQTEYEAMIAEAGKKRATDAKALGDKASEKAAQEAALEDEKESKVATANELASTAKFIGIIHGNCDWLMQYYEARKEARAGEVEALGSAKAVL
eukprot:CAMPEP_0168392268 /NCGR_PEP_ID=MMETSP0228-20121227/18411_1 /TAXON_ID=133427 /ORGANISM="Protoceratium reticulatum, Strain CCCM 535 (=CCMP 1889)" /LENGTH=693 /DNA_ID=CAMNT_0008405605 /DNA_START=34 /DNA_END=2112 /DNA_ORIENTATION=-